MGDNQHLTYGTKKGDITLDLPQNKHQIQSNHNIPTGEHYNSTNRFQIRRERPVLEH